MQNLQELCQKLDRLVADKAWDQGLKTAQKLWASLRDMPEVEPELQVICDRALLTVAEFFWQSADPHSATSVLRRAYELGATENRVDLAIPSLCEHAAFRLGWLFQQAKCHQSAVYWNRRSLSLARPRQVQDHLLQNLYAVAWNLELQQSPADAAVLYDEILSLLWPTVDDALLPARLRYLLPAAMYQLYHGNAALGEAITDRLRLLLGMPDQTYPEFFAAGLFGLGNYYLAQQRADAAATLARSVIPHAAQFGELAADLTDQMHGLIGRAHLQQGAFDAALAEFGLVFDLDPAGDVRYGPSTPIDTLEFWRDVARIRAHLGDLAGAGRAYETLAQALGTYTADWRLATTARIRMTYVALQADVVHELVSVWLSLPDSAARQELDLTVANALLQLKASQFLATQGNRLTVFRDWTGFDRRLFDLNRRFAIAARRLAADPHNLELALALEDALLLREMIESRMVGNAFEFIAPLAEVFHYDFRKLGSVRYAKHTVIDYTVIEQRPPQRGVAGPRLGRRYIGIRLSTEGLRVADLGAEQWVDGLSVALIAEMAKRPQPTPAPIPSRAPAAEGGDAVTGVDRNLVLGAAPVKAQRALRDLADDVYRQVLAPLEPLGRSTVIAPDGSLAALPFHALLRNGRYLVEDIDLSYCHSLLQEESLAYRQRIPGMRLSIDVAGASDMVLLGDADYSDGYATPLEGTKLEIEAVARLLTSKNYSAQDLHRFEGPDATAARVIEFSDPRVLHLAAHGSYLAASSAPPPAAAPADPYKSWRRWEDKGAASLSVLDQALLRAVLVLSPQAGALDDPAGGRLLTALELSSLNLIACRLVALSACETGIGQQERGAGVLGFQYALLGTFAHASLVSLWSVPDLETSNLMTALYGHLISGNWEVRPAYLAALRGACRGPDGPVHPYFWGAFVLLGAVNR
jgi:CHAT domain-containing protein/tetratricopeptide (TPR) repeat protein